MSLKSSALLRVVALTVALLGLAGFGAGIANAAPHPNPPGHLLLSVDGVVAALPPGQAVKVATATCVDRGTPVAAPVTVDAIRLAFPAPVEVCKGVTLTSQVAPEPEPIPVG